MCTLCNTCFLGATRVHNPNSIFIGSTVLHSSQQSRRACTGMFFPQKIALSHWESGPPCNKCFLGKLGPSKSITKMAYTSVQPFFTAHQCHQRCQDMPGNWTTCRYANLRTEQLVDYTNCGQVYSQTGQLVNTAANSPTVVLSCCFCRYFADY